MADAAAAGGGGEEEKAVPYILGLAVALPLTVAVSRLDAGVPRKARTRRPLPCAKPAGWWAFRLPVPLPNEVNSSPETASPPRPQRLLSVCLGLGAPSAPDPDAAAAERPAKRARRCVQCGSTDTPQWRSGPMGPSTLCNACGVRLIKAGALREVVEQRPPPAATPRKAASPPPPESPASESSPDSPICPRRVPLGDVYLVRKQPKRERRPPRREASPEPSPAIYLVKKKKPSKKPWRPRNTGQRCLHCGTTSTPQWREGPMGRHTLCNACGVRYRQGRLLPEYRPAASPTFVPSEHASRHREVLQLHRRQQGTTKLPPRRQQAKDGGSLLDRCIGGTGDDAPESDEDDKNNVFLLRRERPVKDAYLPTPLPAKEAYPATPLHRPLPQQANDDPRVSVNNGSAAGAVSSCGGGGGNVPGDAPGSLDSLLLDGPSAPLIVDGDEFLVS